MIKIVKQLFWKLPISMDTKNRIRDLFPRNIDMIQSQERVALTSKTDSSTSSKYIEEVINLPVRKNESYYREYEPHKPFDKKALLVAYYLTQFHPTTKNNLWWGKGNTEWTNVTKSVPQFVGHLQPRLPADLGYYDLRLKENMGEQIKIAKNYGIGAFCFYYYWFNGERALETPLNMFLENDDLKMNFSICWCNEDWTKRYSGVNSEVLLAVGKTEESYRLFIEDAIVCFKDTRYLTIDGKLVFSVYRPSQVPDTKKTLMYWRSRVKEETGKDLYIIASLEAGIDLDWTKYGFDAMSQFQPASISQSINSINDQIQFIRPDFAGNVYNYESLVRSRVYRKTLKPLTYPAVMPSWDNTARRNNKGMIFINSNPHLYKQWLQDAIEYVSNADLPSKIVFINAWNEWGEAAYLEPDRDYGYAYLQATYEALGGVE